MLVCSAVMVPHVAALGLQPLARRKSALQVPAEMLCFLTIVLPTCMACLCSALWLTLLYAGLVCLVAWEAIRAPRAVAHSWHCRSAALTQFRGAMSVQTAFCILAVDFHAFPRSGAKTLTFGRSIMDLGVGSVIMAGALTRRQSHPTRSPRTAMMRILTRQCPLLLLGVGRLLAVRATSYHEVHSEYGTHWNFFFTLALVSAALPWIEPRSAGGCAAAASALLCVHQWLLLKGLSELVRDAPRVSFVLANKEGLVSLTGYLALALAAAACAPLVPRAPMAEGRGRGVSASEVVRCMTPLLLVDMGLWLASAAADTWLEPTSRRLCNAAYVLWVLAQGLLALACASFRELLFDHGGDGPPLLDALNRYPLTIFLLSNLFTGAVNLSMDTIAVSNGCAVAILALHMSLVCTAAVVLADSPRHRARHAYQLERWPPMDAGRRSH